ncbi:tail fiber protein [Bacteriophage Titan-X]|uniref:Tail fiber protein n=1 Tax=Bacteriophage Titan-X TaxID=2662140 RepID=A0A5Q2UA03_9CAUD|nr:tail fiber protein [Bacteriophage Titan-X]
MANHFRLFGRPLMADEVAPALSVTGQLEGYTMGEAYESRLSINNSIGRCTVEVLESNLPPGAFVRVDNVNKEVVVKWAAFVKVEEEETIVPNGDFENGDDGTWAKGGGNNGEGWSIGTGADYDTYDGAYSARFADVKTGGSDLLLPIIPAKLNDYIRLQAQVQQGASSKGHAGARCSIIYRDSDGRELQRNLGNLVKSGSNGAWNVSVAEGGAPKDTVGVQVVLSAYRSKENKPLWVDAVTWNHKYTLGQDDDSDYSLYIKVTDGANRVAYWRGGIGIDATYVIGQLYPVPVYDDAIAHMPSAQLNLGAGANLLDYATASMPGVVSMSSRSAVLRIAVLEETSSLAGMPYIAGLSQQSVVNRLVLPKEDYTKTSMPTIYGGTSSKVVVRTSGYIDNTKTGMPTIYGMTKT